jgi:flagellar M-ring protein FliF
MDLLKSQLERIQRQLAGLNASQKMLTAALAAIMVITVVWWGKYAGEAEMTALLPQAFSPADMGRIQEHLSEKDVHFTVAGDKIMVPADRRMEILSDLTYARVMPRNMQAGFEEIIKQMSPFDPESNREKLWNHGKEMLLSQLIGSFPDVAQADVIIDATSIQRIEGSVLPSATVNITMHEGSPATQKLVDAAAGAVAGAQSGIALDRIKVIVNGVAQKVHGAEAALADGADQLALIQQNEAWLEDKVRQTYNIPGLHVGVRIKLNTATVHFEKHDFDAKGVVRTTIETTGDTDEVTGPAPAPVEPGTMPNVAMSAGPSVGAAPAQSQTHEKNTEKNQNYVPETITSSQSTAGDASAIGATVNVPLSYFTRVFKSRDPSIKDPTYAQLLPLIQEESIKLRDGIAHCVAVAKPTDVFVDTYVDAAPTLAVQPATASSSSAVSLLVSGHAREIALGVLAVMSLFMASMMVRKSAPSPVPALRVAEPAPSSLLPGELIAGEAVSGDPMMDGMELNEEAVKSRQVVDQVSTMVRENPDAAAALVKRWLSRT